MRIGLIGCGNIGVNAHIPGVKANDGMEIVAAADPTPERLATAGEAAGLSSDNLYADWRDLLARADIDAVIVATPQRFRPEIVIAAAQAGKHILAEKPLALTAAGCDRVTREAGCRPELAVHVGFQRRSNPRFQEGVRRIREHDLGPLARAPGPRGDVAEAIADLADGGARGIRFDVAAAQRAIAKRFLSRTRTPTVLELIFRITHRPRALVLLFPFRLTTFMSSRLDLLG